ncbi:hypothetical protein [Bradyrhizobium sp. CCBAU 51753]|uniref:hypothetical protein n=1 Tax=Bradyrhizobium sp. CCBAU 51753 TaxID=1325100 RepID=UPI003530041C
MRWFADHDKRVLECRRSLISRKAWGGPHDETALIALQYSDSLTAEITTSVWFNSPSRVEIYGDKGFAMCEGTLGGRGEGTILINGQALECTPTVPFDGEIADFAAAVREDREPEVPALQGFGLSLT